MRMTKKKKRTHKKQKDIVFFIQCGAFLLCLLSVFLVYRVLFHSFSLSDLSFKKTPKLLQQISGVQSMEQEKKEQEEGCEFRHGITGVCGADEESVTESLVAVIVENHKDAQPLSGITQADIVYEAPAEGGIPRLLALFRKNTLVEKVGPVRSARPYFLDWLSEYGTPLFFHVGGSPESLRRIAQENIRDMDEFSRSWYFWRSSQRRAPHNTYTSSKLWKGAGEKYGNGDISSKKRWTFETLPVCEHDCVTMIDVDYFYKHEWWYESEENRYLRHQFRRPQIDENGEQIAATTIIVQYVDTRVIDSVGRLAIGTSGSGTALVFQGGRVIEGVWKKDETNGITEWFDDYGEHIPLHPGNIWIEIVSRTDGTVVYE